MHGSLTTGAALAGIGAGSVPVLATGAGHDAAILGAAPGPRRIPTGMLFVRNPTGVSHSPAEFAEVDDCERGGSALAILLRDLAR
jgi:N-carbamoyl-L-amino-acid hydrolase